MSKLFRAIATLWKEYNQFGKQEYEQLRQQNAKLRAEIEAVRRRKQGLDALAQKEVLGGIRATVEELRLAKSTINSEKELIVEAVDQLAEQAVEVVQNATALNEKKGLAAVEALKKSGTSTLLGKGPKGQLPRR